MKYDYGYENISKNGNIKICTVPNLSITFLPFANCIGALHLHKLQVESNFQPPVPPLIEDPMDPSRKIASGGGYLIYGILYPNITPLGGGIYKMLSW